MNTHTAYRRHAHQANRQPSIPGTPAAAKQLAASHDLSLRWMQPPLAATTDKHMAWVRPTELHAYASRAIGRGLDLQAELTRRLRRSPRQLTRTAGRAWGPSRSTDPAAAHAINQEGIQL